MSGLVDFLLVRLADDEALAREVLDCQGGGWRGVGHEIDWPAGPPGTTGFDFCVENDWGQPVCGEGIGNGSTTDRRDCADHIARHASPTRVLAECEAKRQVVALHGDVVRWNFPGMTDLDACRECSGPNRWPCPTIRAVALPYADHPDYREEWRA